MNKSQTTQTPHQRFHEGVDSHANINAIKNRHNSKKIRETKNYSFLIRCARLPTFFFPSLVSVYSTFLRQLIENSIIKRFSLSEVVVLDCTV